MTGILNAISGMAAGASSLYAFTSFEFTNAGQTGQSGPTLGTCLSTYNTTTYPWLNNTAYFNVVTPGIQLWTVPKTGNYTIQAKGAPGGASSSNVASITGTFALTKGDKIRILVGQAGATGTSGCGNSMGGGGGGTFVMKETGSATSDIYVIAAGAGGKSANNSNSNCDASASNTANQGQDNGGLGGTGGNGGAYVSGQCVNNSGAGGGLLTNGGQASGQSTGGLAFVNGGNGGTGFADYGGTIANGGFGGGGGTNSYMGGGGGGYNGGGSGGVASCTCSLIGGGGGGGSYNNGTNQTNTTVTNTGHGSVIITAL